MAATSLSGPRGALLVAPGNWRIEALPAIAGVGPGEVLLAMRFAPVNPADLMSIAGTYALPFSLPAILGAEAVGQVIEVGDGVTEVAPGDHVIPLSRGNWTTQRLLPVAEIVRVPAAMPLADAAMLRVNPATAWRLLMMARLPKGAWALQSGGNTSVARHLAGFALSQEINIISLRRPGQADAPAARILADGPDLAARLAAVTGGAPIQAAFDCVAGETSGRMAACLAPGGQLIVYGHLSAAPCQIPSALLTGAGITVSGFSLRRAEAADSRTELQRLYDDLAYRLLRTGKRQPIAATFPLSRLGEALAYAALPAGGRAILQLDA